MLGEGILDAYLHGGDVTLCREAPATVVRLSERRHLPGGAANAALNARELGARVTLLSVTGDDEEASMLLDSTESRGIRVELVRASSRRTLTKRRVVVDGQILIRLDEGSREPLDPASEDALGQRLAELWSECGAMLVSDYGCGLFTDNIVDHVARLQEASQRPLFIDARELLPYRRVGATAMKPNYEEVAPLLPPSNGSESRPEQVAASASLLLDLLGAQLVAVTLDRDGAVLLERGRAPYRTYAQPRANCKATGAGDTYMAALALSIAVGADMSAAAELASTAADVVVAKDDTATCSAEELRAHLHSGTKLFADKQQLARRIDLYRARGQRIVFTNGCFDILHRGHITYLNQAKKHGDVLVVGLNSDSSVRKLKGPPRPVNKLEDRIEVVAALSCVDHVVPFEGETAKELIEAVRPDVFVKGGDYAIDMLPEASLVRDLGGTVELLPYVEDRSTSGLIERIRSTGSPPAAGATATGEMQELRH